MRSQPQGYFELPRILSRPLELFWAGWRTDTLKLQSAGWQLSAEQNVACDRMRLMLQHEGMRMQAMTDMVDFDYRRASTDWEGLYVGAHRIPVQAMARNIQIIHHGSFDLERFNMHPVDAYPQMTSSTVTCLEDLAHFAVAHTRTTEVVLDEADVPQMLEAILKRQQPGRQERLKAMLREDSSRKIISPRQTFHAQIISIAA